MSNIYITIVRTGKNEVTETVASGSTVSSVLDQAGISSATYRGWSISDEEGDTLNLDTELYASTALICGSRVNGAA